MQVETRDEAMTVIQRELTTFARRARAAAARLHPRLSLVSATLLTHVAEHPGCRAADLAAHYLLDKSTISRQVAALERLGLVERRTAEDDHRAQVLHLTPAGAEVLADYVTARRQAFEQRLAGWSEEDLRRFAICLTRYNDGF